ncbi:MAG: hypothetical protein HY794_00640 [Desulfarculus sp.]|nr:hypothetical protein [Desulfarculus sp.]
MSEGGEWAQERLKQANLIFEPGEKSWLAQVGNFLLWTLEVALVWLLAGWLRP